MVEIIIQNSFPYALGTTLVSLVLTILPRAFFCKTVSTNVDKNFIAYLNIV